MIRLIILLNFFPRLIAATLSNTLDSRCKKELYSHSAKYLHVI